MARILLVATDELARATLRKILKREAHDISEATDAMLAAKLYHEKPADLVIVDLMMPDMRAIDTMRLALSRSVT